MVVVGSEEVVEESDGSEGVEGFVEGVVGFEVSLGCDGVEGFDGVEESDDVVGSDGTVGAEGVVELVGTVSSTFSTYWSAEYCEKSMTLTR